MLVRAPQPYVHKGVLDAHQSYMHEFAQMHELAQGQKGLNTPSGIPGILTEARVDARYSSAIDSGPAKA